MADEPVDLILVEDRPHFLAVDNESLIFRLFEQSIKQLIKGREGEFPKIAEKVKKLSREYGELETKANKRFIAHKNKVVKEARDAGVKAVFSEGSKEHFEEWIESDGMTHSQIDPVLVLHVDEGLPLIPLEKKRDMRKAEEIEEGLDEIRMQKFAPEIRWRFPIIKAGLKLFYSFKYTKERKSADKKMAKAFLDYKGDGPVLARMGDGHTPGFKKLIRKVRPDIKIKTIKHSQVEPYYKGMTKRTNRIGRLYKKVFRATQGKRK